MKRKIMREIAVPDGVECKYEDHILTCRKGDVEVSREINLRGTDLKIKDGKIIVECSRGNKVDLSRINTAVSHIGNLLQGVDEKFVYNLEICYVHFPMTVKVEGNKVVIDNFLGQKVRRAAEIVPGASVEIKGKEVVVLSNDKEKAGQTAANIEKATHIKGKDRRVFQDGIFITSKAGREI